MGRRGSMQTLINSTCHQIFHSSHNNLPRRLRFYLNFPYFVGLEFWSTVMMDESYSSCELSKYRKKKHAETRISSFTTICQEATSSAGMLPRLMQLFKEKIPSWKDTVLKTDVTEIHSLKNMCKIWLFSYIFPNRNSSFLAVKFPGLW